MKKILNLILFSTLLFSSFFYGNREQDILSQPEKHEVTVRLVLVDVIATDKKGGFITDLTKDDFELFEDGKKLPINSVELISLVKGELETIEKRAIKKPGLSSRKKRFIVIFDSINTIKRALERNKPQIIEKLISLVKLGGEIMIFELDEKKGMRILQSFTSDQELIIQAINSASGSIWVEKSTDTLAVPLIWQKEGEEIRKTLEQHMRDMYQFETRNRFEKTINGILSVMSLIKDYPGRKPVLFISGGIPALSFKKFFGGKSVTSDTVVAMSQVEAAKILDPFKVLQKSGFRSGDEILKDMINFANSHNITFYTMDPDNYLRYVLNDIAYETWSRKSYTSDFGDVNGFYKDDISAIKKNELSKLNLVAEDTGGISLLGSRKFDDFQKIVSRDLTNYYELSYYPKRKKADGKYHKIKVKVKRPGIKLRFRRGYYDYDTQQKESLLFASASYNPSLFKQIPFEAQVIPFANNKNKFILWINTALPVQNLILRESEGETSKIFKLRISVEDLDGEKAFIAKTSIPFKLTSSFRKSLENAEYFGFNTCSQALKLKKDKYRVIFALYDEGHGQMGTVEQMLDVPDLRNDTRVEIVNAIFGNLFNNPKKRGFIPFSISQKNGTLQLSKYVFNPMGSNQFRGRENISLFLQVHSPRGRIMVKPQFSIFQNGIEKGSLSAKAVDESWNKKAKILNTVFNVNFSNIPIGEYTLNIKLIDSSKKQEIEKRLLIKII